MLQASSREQPVNQANKRKAVNKAVAEAKKRKSQYEKTTPGIPAPARTPASNNMQ
jgi:hypothetical protein